MKLLFATGNAGKVLELQGLVGDRFEVVSLKAFPAIAEVEETGATFEENARLKALGYARATGLPSLADDSGLCVDALGGAPGVRSARYVDGSDTDRLHAVLRAVANVPAERRGAAFVCVLCLALPDGRAWVRHGEVRGRLTTAPRGSGGFGYDPNFELPSGQTTAELSREEKSRISHRGQAFREMLPVLQMLAAGDIPDEVR